MYPIHEPINGNNEDDKIDLIALLDAPTDAYSRLCVRSWLAVRAIPAEDEAQAEAFFSLWNFSIFIRWQLDLASFGYVRREGEHRY